LKTLDVKKRKKKISGGESGDNDGESGDDDGECQNQ
jgi:hypothetical protein